MVDTASCQISSVLQFLYLLHLIEVVEYDCVGRLQIEVVQSDRDWRHVEVVENVGDRSQFELVEGVGEWRGRSKSSTTMPDNGSNSSSNTCGTADGRSKSSRRRATDDRTRPWSCRRGPPSATERRRNAEWARRGSIGEGLWTPGRLPEQASTPLFPPADYRNRRTSSQSDQVVFLPLICVYVVIITSAGGFKLSPLLRPSWLIDNEV